MSKASSFYPFILWKHHQLQVLSWQISGWSQQNHTTCLPRLWPQGQRSGRKKTWECIVQIEKYHLWPNQFKTRLDVLAVPGLCAPWVVPCWAPRWIDHWPQCLQFILLSIQPMNVKRLLRLDRQSLTAKPLRLKPFSVFDTNIMILNLFRPPTAWPTGRSLFSVWLFFLLLTWITCSSSWTTTRTETWRGWRSRST